MQADCTPVVPGSTVYGKPRKRLANTILKEINKIEKWTLLNFNTYYKATVIKTVWH